MTEHRLIFTKNGISQRFSIDIMNLLGKREGFHAPESENRQPDWSQLRARPIDHVRE